VFMRSLNTGLATLLPVGTLLFVGAGLFGASTLKDLALALFIGLLAGGYSSVFCAVPILAMLKENEPRFRAAEQRIEKGRAAEAASAAAVDAADGEVVEEERVPALTRPATSSRPPARARAGSKKAKRRKRR
jgi:preprotein translocase subunit SecF